MGRHEAPVEAGPLFEFATGLRALRRAAGSPPYRRLERTARFSASALADAASGRRLPTREVTLAYVAACGGDVAAWGERWTRLAMLLRATNPDLLDPGGAPPGDAAGVARQPGSGGPGPGGGRDLASVLASIAEQRESFDAAALDGEPGESDGAVVPGGPAVQDSAPEPEPEPWAPPPWASPSAARSQTPIPPTGAAPAAAAPLGRDDPRRVGPFHIVGRLGGGAMGDVYLGASPAGRPVAVKLIRRELAREPVFRHRFARELAAARTVTGGHTPAVVDADPDADRPWIATAYVPGPSLGQAVDEGGPLPEPVVLALAAGIAEALTAIHTAGIVHRDLKPGNILLDHDGPKVIDFGISRALEASSLTATGMVVGTAGYTAPELAARGEAGPAADVFSLGCVLAYAATGIAPFGEGRSSDVLYRVVHEPPDPAALACQDAHLRRLVASCLDKDPAARPTPDQIIHAAANPGEATLPAALAAQIAQRGRDAAQLLTRAQRARTVRRVRIGLAPLLLILAIATVAAMTIHGAPTRLDTAPPPTTGTTPSVIQSPSISPDPALSVSPSASGTAATSLPNQAESDSSSPQSNADQQRNAPQLTGGASAQLGSPNFDGYCQATGQGSVQLVANNAYGWRCSGDNGTGDDAEAVCQWTFGTTQIANRVANFNDPHSWQCWASTGELGTLDWNAYCQDKGWGDAVDSGTNNAYTWTCSGNSNALDSQDACLTLYRSNPSISRFQNFYDKNSWQCWG